MPAFASGLDFRLSGAGFCALLVCSDALGYSAFKIKVGHPVFVRGQLAAMDSLKRLFLGSNSGRETLPGAYMETLLT